MFAASEMFWKERGTITMEDVASVVVEKRRVTVEGAGQRISVKALVREDAEAARLLIEDRMKVHTGREFVDGKDGDSVQGA